jgi:hypothetical protein
MKSEKNAKKRRKRLEKGANMPIMEAIFPMILAVLMAVEMVEEENKPWKISKNPLIL